MADCYVCARHLREDTLNEAWYQHAGVGVTEWGLDAENEVEIHIISLDLQHTRLLIYWRENVFTDEVMAYLSIYALKLESNIFTAYIELNNIVICVVM